MITFEEVADAVIDIKANSNDIAVILCLYAQEKTGKTVTPTKLLEKLNRGNSIPVIFLVYKESTEVTAKLLQSGAWDVLGNPLVLEVLMRRVGCIVEASWAKKMLKEVSAFTSLKKELDDLKVAHNELEKQFEEQNGISASLELSLTHMKEQCEELDLNLQDTKKTLSERDEQLRDIFQRSSKSFATIEEQDKQIRILDSNNAELNEIVLRMEKKEKEKDQEIKSLKEREELLEKILKTKEEKIFQSENNINTLKVTMMINIQFF